ncbi:MAG: uracil-DNA glycosylase [Anaerolineae bacterium]|nr:uracil-DNA glycosylase [Anaerolineae bacterium]
MTKTLSLSGELAWQKLNAEVITCGACPRLVKWREQVAREKRRAYRDWDYWGKPVPGFGDLTAPLLIVGLAPGAHGANRTGRMFTGDGSGDTLYRALYETGFANQPVARHPDDGLILTDAFITAVGRCAPPGNRPTTAELDNCRPFLRREWQLLPQIRVVVALGQIAFEGCMRLMRELGHEVPRLKFGHGLHYQLNSPIRGGFHHLIASYHPSRQNTQTGRLTPKMLNDVFSLARSLLD